ncbi:hypothetical protein CICLE_v10013833mg, partial [Citrus x clementina]
GPGGNDHLAKIDGPDQSRTARRTESQETTSTVVFTFKSRHLANSARRLVSFSSSPKAKRHAGHVAIERLKSLACTSFAYMASRRNVQYSRLSTDDDDEYDGSRSRRYDPRFDYSPKAFDKIPWKSIVLALFLLCLGSLLLFLSLFIFTGHMGGETAQAFGLLVLGILAFLPGFYETRIAYYSWRGAEGYRFASIPDY